MEASMDNDLCVLQRIPTGRLKGIHLDILSEQDAEKLSALVIGNVNEVCDPALGLPTLNGADCSTCGALSSKSHARTSKDCEGHFGLINLPCTILNPYHMKEIAELLNKICPGCKSLRRRKSKDTDPSSSVPPPRDCRYCTGTYRNGHPKMKFKVSTKEVFAKTAITAEVDEKLLKKSSCKLANDYWDVIPHDSTISEESGSQSNRRVLLSSQVYSILKDVRPEILDAQLGRKNAIFVNSILVTPNSHRVNEFGGRMIQDETTRKFKRLIDFRGSPNDLSVYFIEFLKASKIRSEKVSTTQQAYEKQSSNDSVSSSSGLKNLKELLVGKRSNHSFRLVVVGDTKIKVDEIGLPVQIAENVLVTDHINLWNWEKLEPCCEVMIEQKGTLHVTRDGQKIVIRSMDKLRVGDAIQRPLIDGDIVLINRPPSIHQHSLIALSVRILPIVSVVSINPAICSPLSGDFDGDCLHCYVPQSIITRVELKELLTLDKQLCNGQNGQNLLSFCQDSLSAAYLILQDGVLLSRSEMHQLQMFCSYVPTLPAIMQSTSTHDSSFWTGKQLFSQLLPADFDFARSSNEVTIKNGDILSSSRWSSWLRDSDRNLFQGLIRHCPEKVLNFLSVAQDMLCEWLHKRGLSVSLSDLCLNSDQETRKNLKGDIAYGLEMAERLSDISLLMVDENQQFLIESSEEDENMMNDRKEHLYISQQTSAELCHASLSASKSVFRGMQNLVYQYAGNNNSFISMLKAGSKGNLQKLFQHSMCLGLQHSVTPLSFSIPRHHSCASWNNHKNHVNVYKRDGVKESTESYIPCTVIRSSYLEGLNPLECFVHSLTSRDSTFGGQADVSGTLSRKIMFFMRDLIVGYDGTVRNCYGNQVVQFSYGNDVSDFHGDGSMAPVGSLAACAISETAYSALDQPVSVLEPSPLLALKKVLECGVKKNTGSKSASLFLSRRLGRWVNGFEYGALEVKDHLERLFFRNVVTEVNISHSISSMSAKNASPWVCHFHVNKDLAKKKRLKTESIIKALDMNYKATATKMKVYLPELFIESGLCSEADHHKESNSKICISVSTSRNKFSDPNMEIPKDFSEPVYLRDTVIPVLLQTVIKGFPEFEKVDVLWKDGESHLKLPSGELYLRVFMSDYCDRTKFWSTVMEKCLRVRDVVDWERSHPDDILDYSASYGIDVAWHCFVNRLHSAITDTGKTILPEHLIVTANCLSVTGAFVPLHARGLAQQRKEAQISSPFMQACFSSPADTLVKAAKAGQTDCLQGSVDSLAWGQTPPIGTGGQFELILKDLIMHQECETTTTTDISSQYSMLCPDIEVKPNEDTELSLKITSGNSVGQKQFWKKNWRKTLVKGMIPQINAVDEVHWFKRALKNMLQEYSLDNQLSKEDKTIAMKVLQCHPRWEEKSGSGDVEIKVGLHPEHEDSKCFILVKSDGTEEDISYRKCIHHALELINPVKAKAYRMYHLDGGN